MSQKLQPAFKAASRTWVWRALLLRQAKNDSCHTYREAFFVRAGSKALGVVHTPHETIAQSANGGISNLARREGGHDIESELGVESSERRVARGICYVQLPIAALYTVRAKGMGPSLDPQKRRVPDATRH